MALVGQLILTITNRTNTLIQLFFVDGIWRGSERGSTKLWESIERAYNTWSALGRPGIQAYSVAWDVYNQHFYLLGPCFTQL